MEEFKIQSLNYIMLLFSTFGKLDFAIKNKNLVNKENRLAGDVADSTSSNLRMFLSTRGK